MTTTLSITESQTLAALRSFLLAALPAGVEVVKAQDNRVAEVEGANFVTMTPILREQLATNTAAYSDGYPSLPSVRTDLQQEKVTIQLDIHGPASADNTQIIKSLFRTEWATTQFSASGIDVVPLYMGEPKQIPFLNAEQQIEERWTVDAVLQANPITTVNQDFTQALTIGIKPIDQTFHP